MNRNWMQNHSLLAFVLTRWRGGGGTISVAAQSLGPNSFPYSTIIVSAPDITEFSRVGPCYSHQFWQKTLPKTTHSSTKSVAWDVFSKISVWSICRFLCCMSHYIELDVGITGLTSVKLLIIKWLPKNYILSYDYSDCSVQDCSNSSALAMELLQSCVEP